MTIGCCGCCSAFRPRYKRLVDNIFPPNPGDGLVKSNMDHLTWYAMNSPDKLDRIGDYLAQRLYRDIHRQRIVYVFIAMDALDQLLVTCHANNLNLFVESFLQMIQRLLESTDPVLQLRATQSFEKFANIKEDTPSYHRRYDFLVGKFSSMCYSSIDDSKVRQQLRMSGIKGLQGVVRKTDWDNLGDHIWQPSQLDKIVPALLFNMQDKLLVDEVLTGSCDVADNPPEIEKEPHVMAEMCLRELFSRATYGKITNVIKPLLIHLDHNDLWTNNEFAVHTFKVLMYSIQVQYSISVIELLMSHLNEKATDPAKCRIGIADVLSKIIPIAAGECVGPSVIDIINSLLEHIRSSVVGISTGKEISVEETTYQETLIHALGEYANHLPDYQKIETMVFILNKVPGTDKIDDLSVHRPEFEVKLQHLLLKSLLKVGTKYTTVYYGTTFSQSFLIRLIRISMSSDPKIRLTVQQIFHTLIDRHDNAEKLSSPVLEINKLSLTVGKPIRQDVNFWKKFGNEILLCVQENSEFANNSLANTKALYTTLLLLMIEIRSDDVLVDILRVIFHIQEIAKNDKLGVVARIHLYALVAAIFAAISMYVPCLHDHVAAVIKKRSDEASHLLPELQPQYEDDVCINNLLEEYLFNFDTVFALLKDSNFDENRLSSNISSIVRRPSTMNRHHTSSITDINVEVDSVASSPGVVRKTVEEEVTFESLKKVLSEPPESLKKQREDERKMIVEAFMTASLDVLVSKIHSAHPDVLQAKLTEIFSHLPPSYPSHSSVSSSQTSPPITSIICESPPTYISFAASQTFYPEVYIY